MNKTSYSPFDFVRAVRTKSNAFDDFPEDKYVPFIINRALSYDLKTVFHANEMNKYSDILSKKAQFDFYLNSISKSSGYTPWYKQEKIEEIQYIMQYYDVSTDKAKEMLNLLNKDQISIIKKKIMNKDKKNE